LTAGAIVDPFGTTNSREETLFKIRHLLPLAALAAVLGYAVPSSAETIIDEWATVKAVTARAQECHT
jgi:hypothetical protein